MPAIHVTCALIERGGRVLIAQRGPGKHLAGKWEFPGGKIDLDETPDACLRREILEELGCSVTIQTPLTPVTHSYPATTIHLLPFRCTLNSGEPTALEHRAIDWIEPQELLLVDLAEADRPIAREYLIISQTTDSAARTVIK